MLAAVTFVIRYWRVIAAVVGVVVLLGGAGVYIAKVKHDAYAQGYSAATAKCEADKRLMEAANKKAADEAAKKLADTAGKLELKEIQLDDYQKAIDLAADASPNAISCGIDADSVRRLGSIQ